MSKVYPSINEVIRDNIDNDELLSAMEEINEENSYLKEQIIFAEAFLRSTTLSKQFSFTNNINDETSSSTSEQTKSDNVSVSSGGEKEKIDVKKKKSKKRRRQTKNLQPLSLEKKLKVVIKQLEELDNQVKQEEKMYKKKLENYKASLEEADIEMESADKEHKEFVRMIVNGGLNERTGKVIAEKLLNYLENGIKQRDQLIDKYRLKNTSIKQQIGKLKQHLEHREEMGEVLTKIDFHQLKIENDQMRSKISERNAELVELKGQTGKSQQILTNLMDKLNRLTQSASVLQQQIDIRVKHVNQLKKEIIQVEKEKIQQKRKHQYLIEHHDQVRVPSILDYVKIKAELDVVRKEETNWRRKVEISEANKKLWARKREDARNHV